MIKIHDCSNSPERPSHRSNSGCPVENDMMKDLKKYCPDDFKFVQDWNDADVIITNDIFPTSMIDSAKIKVKRMDGIYWQEHLKERNEPLNHSAQKADLVIFISEFSRKSYFELYGQTLNKNIVILNNADDTIFYKTNSKAPSNHFYLCASASNWSRPEKRFKNIIEMMSILRSDPIFKMNLIGTIDSSYRIPLNIISHGYIEDQKRMAEILNKSDVFINFSYKDACPKTVWQAKQCQLPILYANSGGLPEIVKEFGYPIDDNKEYKFESETPELDISQIISGFYNLLYSWKDTMRVKNVPYRETMNDYFQAIREVYNSKA